MKWTNVFEIVESLCEKCPEYSIENVQTIPFPQLSKLVMDLKFFDDSKENCNEKILEAIQAAWIDEIE